MTEAALKLYLALQFTLTFISVNYNVITGKKFTVECSLNMKYCMSTNFIWSAKINQQLMSVYKWTRGESDT